MNKEKIYKRIKNERAKVINNSVKSFIDDYKKYDYTLIEVYDRILTREFRGIIKK